MDTGWDNIFSFSWFTTWMWSIVEYLLLNQLALVAGFRRVSSLAFSLVLSLVLCVIVDVTVCNS